MQAVKSTKLIATLIVILSCLLPNAYASISPWQQDKSGNSQIRIISSSFDNQDHNQKLIIGINFQIKNGWKIYGHDDSSTIGLPPIFDFNGSSNYQNHQIIWPEAKLGEEKIGNETIKYSYYQDQVIIPIIIDLKNNQQPTSLQIKINYGLCSDICIPATTEFNLNLTSLEQDHEALSLIQPYYQVKITDDNKKLLESTYGQKLLAGLIAALIGGMILNIMPCVLPVLSIKLISIINHTNTTISRIRIAFLATITGIVFCFLILATITAIAKFIGNDLGWGLQFQNRYFLIFLILVLTIFSANLFGLFEIKFSQIIGSNLNKKISGYLSDEKSHNKNIFIGNFLSGILAVLLATPCSAPFLGTAISFALTQNIITIFLIFTAIAIGVASPYILLLITPKLVHLLPKPGKWMLITKKIMASFLVLTIIWLLFILIDIKETSKDIWIKFDQKQIPTLVSQGKTVVIDVTANWCLTCKLNKTMVLNDKKVVAKLNQANIVAMRADITKPNQEVMDFLRANNRFAIPFNAVYGPKIPNGKVTSELLNKEELLQLINQASNYNE